MCLSGERREEEKQALRPTHGHDSHSRGCNSTCRQARMLWSLGRHRTPSFLRAARLFGFTPYFGDVWRGLVSPVLLCRGDTHCYAVSASYVGTPPPLRPAPPVPHRDRYCDAPP